MTVNDYEKIVERLMERVFSLSVGAGMPEFVLVELERTKKDLVVYKGQLKSPVYIARVNTMIDSLDKKIPEVREQADRNKKERERAILNNLSLEKSSPVLTGSQVTIRKSLPERRNPKTISLLSKFKQHERRPPKLTKA
ncbi:MAG: hypothetical protein KJ069_16395 [Anaerolineae bacterium]|nr:hypothetical protein [Anaerolineae bacterium]